LVGARLGRRAMIYGAGALEGMIEDNKVFTPVAGGIRWRRL